MKHTVQVKCDVIVVKWTIEWNRLKWNILSILSTDSEPNKELVWDSNVPNCSQNALKNSTQKTERFNLVNRMWILRSMIHKLSNHTKNSTKTQNRYDPLFEDFEQHFRIIEIDSKKLDSVSPLSYSYFCFMIFDLNTLLVGGLKCIFRQVNSLLQHCQSSAE